MPVRRQRQSASYRQARAEPHFGACRLREVGSGLARCAGLRRGPPRRRSPAPDRPQAAGIGLGGNGGWVATLGFALQYDQPHQERKTTKRCRSHDQERHQDGNVHVVKAPLFVHPGVGGEATGWLSSGVACRRDDHRNGGDRLKSAGKLARSHIVAERKRGVGSKLAGGARGEPGIAACEGGIRPRQILRVKRRPNGRRVCKICRGQRSDACPIRQC